MKRFLYAGTILVFVLAALFASPTSAYANEGDGEGALEMEVNGYHVTIASQNDWAKGENTVIVTITDGMGMPLSDADVEILITPKESGHDSPESDSHGNEQENMPSMDMGASAEAPTQQPGVMSPMGEMATSGEMTTNTEETIDPLPMTESEHGAYTATVHLEATGEHDAHVLFHVNGEMLQADFTVSVTGSNSKSVVLWSFALVNAAVVVAAGAMKKQKSLIVKGAR